MLKVLNGYKLVCQIQRRQKIMIKKTLAVILSLMLLMSLTSALAASSKTNTDISHGTVEVPGVLIQIVKVPDTDFTKKLKLEVAAAQEKGNILEAFAGDVKNLIPEEHTEANEMETVQFDGELGKVTDKVKVTYKFATPYGKDQKVTVMIGFPEKDNPDYVPCWEAIPGVGTESGEVEFYVTRELLDKIETEPFVIIPLSKKKV